MLRKLNLFQKGLLVIAFPILVQLVYLGSFSRLLNQSEALDARDFQSKIVIGRLNWLATLLSTTALAGVMYAITDEAKYLDLYNHGAASLPAEVKATAGAVSVDHRESQLALDAPAAVGKIIADLNCCIAAPANMRLQKIKETSQDAYSTWYDLFRMRHELLRVENTRYKSSWESMPEFRNRQKQMILWWIALDLILAAWLFHVYNQGVTKRLSLLTSNVDRFARREPLHQVDAGQDEISRLDRNFHDMAEKVRMAERQKQDYIAMLNHDLRTPLSAVLGSIDLVCAGSPGPISDDARKTLIRAQRSAESMLNLVNELLDFEKFESGTMTLSLEMHSIKTLLNDAVDALRSLADGRQIKLLVAGADCEAKVDRERLKRVVINLLGNALKFSPAESTIAIDLVARKTEFEVKIKDQGPGIPAAKQAIIFDRYQQVDPSDAKRGSGVGLGLAICKAIVEAHHGNIGVTSAENEGSTFWFVIPTS